MISLIKHSSRWVKILLVAGFLMALSAGSVFAQATQTHPHPDYSRYRRSAPKDSYSLFFPVIAGPSPWVSLYGVEPTSPVYSGRTYYTRTLELNVGWVRMGTRISWRSLQPTEGDPIQWDQLATFESELRSLNSAGIRPVVTITDSPLWATIADWACGAVRTDKLPAFADFMRQLVLRYSTPEFNLHNWELGNEPDVDPRLVPKDSGFGCWGNADDPDYYGGVQYGEMLKLVTPAIRNADPQAVIWIGGLLLDSPNTSTNCGLPNCGKPEWFLKGILQAGAAPYFDVVAYHAYPRYNSQKIDQDNGAQGNWYSWGGYTVGKARFLREIMSSYGVVKPLVLNEISLMCVERDAWCRPPGDSFFQMQADFAVRSMVRGLAENIGGFYWYTLNGPGWRYTGLLTYGDLKPAFTAYQQLIHRLEKSYFSRRVDYGQDIEAYAFGKGAQEIHVLWAKTDMTVDVRLPAVKFIAAYTRDGDSITPVVDGSDYLLSVGFSPVYLIVTP